MKALDLNHSRPSVHLRGPRRQSADMVPAANEPREMKISERELLASPNSSAQGRSKGRIALRILSYVLACIISIAIGFAVGMWYGGEQTTQSSGDEAAQAESSQGNDSDDIGATESNTNQNRNSGNSGSSSKPSSSTNSLVPFADLLSSAYGDYEPIVVSGNGDDIVTLDHPNQPFLIGYEYSGTNNFVVKGLDEDGEQEDVLVNQVGACQGTVANWEGSDSIVYLQVKANGPWTLTFSPLSDAPLAEQGETYHGPNVMILDADDVKKLRFTHSGDSNFIVKGAGVDKAELLVDEVGSYDGTVAWNQGQSLIFVDADGDWTIEWE